MIGLRGRFQTWVRWTAVIAILCAAAPAVLGAQGTVQSSGRVTTTDSVPVRGAQIQVTTETAEHVRGTTDAEGRYRVRLPNVGSTYVVSVEARGYEPITRLLERPAGTATVWTMDFALLPQAIALKGLSVRPPRLSIAGATRSVPGTNDRSRAGITLQGEPAGYRFDAAPERPYRARLATRLQLECRGYGNRCKPLGRRCAGATELHRRAACERGEPASRKPDQPLDWSGRGTGRRSPGVLRNRPRREPSRVAPVRGQFPPAA